MHKVSMAPTLLSLGVTKSPLRTEKMMDTTSKNIKNNKIQGQDLGRIGNHFRQMEQNCEKSYLEFSRVNTLATLREIELNIKK